MYRLDASALFTEDHVLQAEEHGLESGFASQRAVNVCTNDVIYACVYMYRMDARM